MKIELLPHQRLTLVRFLCALSLGDNWVVKVRCAFGSRKRNTKQKKKKTRKSRLL